jgi:CheY-like chemotaxis protein
MNNSLSALVVDDSSSMRHYVATILREAAHINNVLEAVSGDDAIKKITSYNHLQFGCIFLDVEMPGMDTEQFLAHIRSNPSTMNVPCILLTAKQPQDAEKIASAFRVDDYLCKPFSPEELLHSCLKVFVLEERRSAMRELPPQPCEIDLGFDNYNHYSVELVNISATGCLIRTGILGIGAGHIFDIGSIVINPATADAFELCGQIVRIQAEKTVDNAPKFVLIAFEFKSLDPEKQHRLKNYLLSLGYADGCNVD